MNQNAFQPGNHIPPFPTGAFPPGILPQTPGGQVVAFPPHLPHPIVTAAPVMNNNREGSTQQEEQVC